VAIPWICEFMSDNCIGLYISECDFFILAILEPKKVDCLLSIEMYEAQLTQKSLSNQTAFCWSAWRICVTNLKLLRNLRGEIFALTWNPWVPRFLLKWLDFTSENSPKNGKCASIASYPAWLACKKIVSKYFCVYLHHTLREPAAKGQGEWHENPTEFQYPSRSLYESFKGLVHPKMKFLWLITHPHAIPNAQYISSSSEHKLRYFWWNLRVFIYRKQQNYHIQGPEK